MITHYIQAGAYEPTAAHKLLIQVSSIDVFITSRCDINLVVYCKDGFTIRRKALRCVSRALTLVAMHWNARIDSDPISAFPCVAFMRLIKIF